MALMPGGNCCAANDVCCHGGHRKNMTDSIVLPCTLGGCCSQGSVCCRDLRSKTHEVVLLASCRGGNGLCGLPGSKCEDGVVLAPPIHTSHNAQASSCELHRAPSPSAMLTRHGLRRRSTAPRRRWKRSRALPPRRHRRSLRAFAFLSAKAEDWVQDSAHSSGNFG